MSQTLSPLSLAPDLPILIGMTLRERIYGLFGTNMRALGRELPMSHGALEAAFRREEARATATPPVLHGHNIDTETALKIQNLIASRGLPRRSLSWILTGEDNPPLAADQQLTIARRVATSLARQNGLKPADARAIVGRLVLDEAVRWEDEFALYQGALKAAGLISVKESAGDGAPATPTTKPAASNPVVGVGKKVATRRKA